MKIKLLILISISFISCTSNIQIKKNSDFNKYISKYISNIRQKYGIVGMSVAIIDGNKTIFAKGFGYSDRNKKILATKDTVYRVGSVSKLVNLAAILKLQDKKLLDINKPISNYIDFYTKDSKNLTQKVTLKNILTHYSGLAPLQPFGGTEDKKMYKCTNLLKLIHNSYLQFEPNSFNSYSNQAIALSGCIVSKVTNMKYSKYLKQNILKPLNMSSSDYGINIVGKNVSKSYYNNKELKGSSYYYLPAIGLSASVEDMSHFVKMVLNNGKYKQKQILSKNAINSMFNLKNNTSSKEWSSKLPLGWFVDNSGFEDIYYHTGKVGEYISVVAIMKKSKLGVVIECNSDNILMDLLDTSKDILFKLWSKKYNKPIPRRAKEIKHPKFSVNFEGIYAIESLKSDIMVVKKDIYNRYKATTSKGLFYFKKYTNNCYRVEDPNNIFTFYSRGYNRCFKIANYKNGNKEIVLQKHEKDYITFATAINKQQNKSKLWSNYIGKYKPVKAIKNRYSTTIIDIKRLKISKIENKLFLTLYYPSNIIYDPDGIYLYSPLKILNKNLAQGVAQDMLGKVEAKVKNGKVFIVIDGFEFEKIIDN